MAGALVHRRAHALGEAAVSKWGGVGAGVDDHLVHSSVYLIRRHRGLHTCACTGHKQISRQKKRTLICRSRTLTTQYSLWPWLRHGAGLERRARRRPACAWCSRRRASAGPGTRPGRRPRRRRVAGVCGPAPGAARWRPRAAAAPSSSSSWLLLQSPAPLRHFSSIVSECRIWFWARIGTVYRRGIGTIMSTCRRSSCSWIPHVSAASWMLRGEAPQGRRHLREAAVETRKRELGVN